MGEARYFMNVLFDSEERATEALPRIESFLKRMAECEGARQANVPYDIGQAVLADIKLREQYPDVFDALEIQQPEAGHHSWNCLNYLAGLLDSPYSPHGLDDFNIHQSGSEVRFSGTVWHFANWDGLGRAMKTLFGALDAGWISDEYAEVDYHEMIERMTERG